MIARHSRTVDMLNWLSALWRRSNTRNSGQLDPTEYSVHPPNLTFLSDVSPGRWMEERWPPHFGSVGSLVPGGYSAYARVLHPARNTRDESVPWSAVAEWSGRVYHPIMSFEGISVPTEGSLRETPPWDHDPRHGSIDEDVALELADLLSCYTDTDELCYFGVWEGYGEYSGGTVLLTSDGRGRRLGVPRDIRRAQRVKGSGFHYLLYEGTLEGILGFYSHFLAHPPNIWWPSDRAWFVATDVDLDSTYIGASQECIDALLGHPTLEAVPAEYLASVAMTADTINLGDQI